MAKQIITTYVDDIDGSTADKTELFGLGGKTYEIDLSSANLDKLHDALAEFIEHGRPVTVSKSNHRPARNGVDRKQNADIREWARAQGIKVSERGRISGEVVAAYQAGHAA